MPLIISCIDAFWKVISALWISPYDASLKGGKYYGTVCGYHGNRHFGCAEAELAEECGKKKGGDTSSVCMCMWVCEIFECMKAMKSKGSAAGFTERMLKDFAFMTLKQTRGHLC